MKAGRVISLRINPIDCLSVIDAAEKIGMLVPGVSFSQLVSIVLSSSLESFRQNKIIPTRDGFEYTQMMARFPEPKKQARSRALAITETFKLGAVQGGSVPATVPAPPNMKRKEVRYEELVQRFHADAANMSEEEVREMHSLALELNP